MSSARLSNESIEDLLDAVLERWRPLGAPLHDEGTLLFDGPRILESPVRDTAPEWIVARLQDVDARTLLARALRQRRPLASDIGHGSVADLSPAVMEILEAFGLRCDPETATRLIRALPYWMRRTLGGVDRGGAVVDGTLRGVLQDGFHVAELAWALGSASAAARDRDVVAAAVEAAASIATVLLQVAGEHRGDGSDLGPLDEELLVRMHLARMEWVRILLRFDEYADLVADGGRVLNVRLARLVGRVPTPTERSDGFVHLFVADPLPRVADQLGRLAVRAEQDRASGEDLHEHERLAYLADKVGEEERQRFLDVGARLLLPRYLLDHAIGMLWTLTADEWPALKDGARARRMRLWMRRTAWPLVAAAVSGVLMLFVATAYFAVGLFELFGTDVPLPPEGLPEVVSPVLRWAFPALGSFWVLLVLRALRRGNRAASYALLLRVPAATAFGLAILLALSFAWIDTQVGLGRSGPIVAIAASAVYAWIEFINQGGERRRARRGRRGVRPENQEVHVSVRPYVDLPLIALGIATSVSALVLEVFGRTLLTQVDGYDLLRSDPFVYLQTLATLSSVSLAIGTFLQAIWDEQPITAPLSSLRLRG